MPRFGVLFCMRYGLPFTEADMKHWEAATRLAMQVLQDLELRKEFSGALTFPRDSLGEEA
ncbi:MAG: hypothetical protein GXO65_01900 [Euryarchaeota archaeon]|nr:hypothetical protein [Euryarchaeota archaeon]